MALWPEREWERNWWGKQTTRQGHLITTHLFQLSLKITHSVTQSSNERGGEKREWCSWKWHLSDIQHNTHPPTSTHTYAHITKCINHWILSWPCGSQTHPTSASITHASLHFGLVLSSPLSCYFLIMSNCNIGRRNFNNMLSYTAQW